MDYKISKGNSKKLDDVQSSMIEHALKLILNTCQVKDKLLQKDETMKVPLFESELETGFFSRDLSFTKLDGPYYKIKDSRTYVIKYDPQDS